MYHNLSKNIANLLWFEVINVDKLNCKSYEKFTLFICIIKNINIVV